MVTLTNSTHTHGKKGKLNNGKPFDYNDIDWVYCSGELGQLGVVISTAGRWLT
jgi:hypothetical protein